jgi:hypothetical protein
MSNGSDAIAAARDSLLGLAKAASKRPSEDTLAAQFERLANLGEPEGRNFVPPEGRNFVPPQAAPGLNYVPTPQKVRFTDADPHHSPHSLGEPAVLRQPETLVRQASEFLGAASDLGFTREFAASLTLAVFHGAWNRGVD